MHSFFYRIFDSKPAWTIRKQLRKIWVRVVGFGLFAFLTAVVAQYLGHLVPSGFGDDVGTEAVDQILNILASSMLAVTTFSLSIAVSAYASAANLATPRATELLQEDDTSQNVLATFLGAFLFSLVGIIGLKAGFYTENGRFVLFAATNLIIILVVVALIRWISHLTDFGRMHDILDRVEQAASNAIQQRMVKPWLGGQPQRGPAPEGSCPVYTTQVGFVQRIDMEELSLAIKNRGIELWIAVLPGSFVHPKTPLLFVNGVIPDEDLEEELRTAFTCGQDRDFDQNPKFAMQVMSEVASRALSPAVNDPGTAIDVLGRSGRILAPWTSHFDFDVEYPNIHVATLTADELLSVLFRPISRDGAAFFEVQLRLQEVLRSLSEVDPDTFESSAKYWSKEALRRASEHNMNDDELAILRDMAIAD